MTAPNHVAGGIVITGIFCSLYNVNIFANPWYITTTIVSSLIPDIDHTKSIIGKAVYPLAKFISIKYGHRTITHSLFFLGLCTGSIYLLEHLKILHTADHQLSLIVFYGVFSHLLLDMFTLQGIPLCYPFYRNPCVIPANPDLRIRTGNLKQEGIVLFIFGLSTVFLQDLFKDGFWFTYNKKFNDITHLHREFDNSNTLLEVEYDFNLFQNNYKGKGFLVYADFLQCYILGDTLIHLNKDRQGQLIHSLTPKRTQHTLTVASHQFNKISIDSLNSLLAYKFITEIELFSNQKVEVLTKEKLERESYFRLKNQYNLHVISSYKDSLNQKRGQQIKELKHRITLEADQLSYTNQKYYRFKNQFNLLQKRLKSNTLNNYQYDKTQLQLNKLESFLQSNFPKRSKTLVKLKHDLSILEKNNFNQTVFFSGQMLYFKLPKLN